MYVSVRLCSQVWNAEPAHRDAVQFCAGDPQPWNATLQDDEDAESAGRGSHEIMMRLSVVSAYGSEQNSVLLCII